MKLEVISAPLVSLLAVDGAMHRLLMATLRQERLLTDRDVEIASIMKRHAAPIEKALREVADLEAQIEQYYVSHPPEDKKSVQLANGLMGMRSPSNPGLVPLNDKWDWDKIAAKVRSTWKAKYFHAPKAPWLDKVKLKKDLDEFQLKKLGLALDASETFYLELNRLAVADEYTEAA